MELRIRPKSDYLHKANWEELFVLTEHWKSDIEFYRDESRFLTSLVDKYFIWLIKDGNIAKVKTISNKLSKIKKQKKEIYESINKHLMHLEELMGNPFVYEEKNFRKEHEILENEFADFIKNFKLLKREIFAITEKVIEDENVNHLLTT